jgi:hypothetical protein
MLAAEVVKCIRESVRVDMALRDSDVRAALQASAQHWASKAMPISGNAISDRARIGCNELTARAEIIWETIQRCQDTFGTSSDPELLDGLQQQVAEHIAAQNVDVQALANVERSNLWANTAREHIPEALTKRRNELIERYNNEARFYTQSLITRNAPDKIAVTSHGQAGGITAHTVNVSVPTPAPLRRHWWQSWWAALIGLATIVSAVIALLSYFGVLPHVAPLAPLAPNVTTPEPSPVETDYHGWLRPANDPTPSTACTPDSATAQGWFLMTVAGGGVYTLAPTGKLIAIAIGDQPTVVLERSDNGLLLDVDMLNKSGALAVHIEHNEWRAMPSQMSYQKRPDPSTLVVYDVGGKEMLWVRYMNPNTVKIRGTFYKLGDAEPIVISDSAIQLGRNVHLFIPFLSQGTTFVPCFVVGIDNFRDPIFTFR